MTSRHLLLSALAAFIVCSPGLAAPPEGKPVLVPLWKKTTVGLPKEDDLHWENHLASQRWLKEQFAAFIKTLQTRGRPMIPPAVPTGVENEVIYYSDHGAVATSLKASKTEDGIVKAGEVRWLALNDFSLIQLLEDSGQKMLKDWTKRHSPEELSDFFCHRTLATSVTV